MGARDYGLPAHHLRAEQVIQRLQITARQLDHWCRNGVVGPQVATPGSGYLRVFSPEDVRALEVVSHLARFGAKVATMAAAARLVKANTRSGWLLLNEWGQVTYAAAEGSVARTVGKQPYIIVPVPSLRHHRLIQKESASAEPDE